MRPEALERVKLVFTLLDADGSGRLEKGDFNLMARRVIEVAPSAAHEAKERMIRAFERYWSTLRSELDANDDGMVTLDEFTACVLSPERFEETSSQFAQALVGLGDPGGNGRVCRSTFMALMTAMGFGSTNTSVLYDALGPAEDEQISAVDWIKALNEYYQPEAAGIAVDHLVRIPAV